MPQPRRADLHRAEHPWDTQPMGAMTTWEAKEIGDTPYQRALRAEREVDRPDILSGTDQRER